MAAVGDRPHVVGCKVATQSGSEMGYRVSRRQCAVAGILAGNPTYCRGRAVDCVGRRMPAAAGSTHVLRLHVHTFFLEPAR